MGLFTKVCFVVGISLRLWLFRTGLPEWVESRNEISTPLTSWKRVTEGLSLHRDYISPYSGDIFHETPLMLRFLDFVSQLTPNYLYLLFVAVDAIIGVVLMNISFHFAKYMLSKQSDNVKTYHFGAKNLILKVDELKVMQSFVLAAHFLNPYSIVTCLAKSTAIFTNLFVLLVFLFTVLGNEMLATLFIAVATYQSMYPIALIIPAAIFFLPKSCNSFVNKNAIVSYIRTVGVCTMWLGLLIYLSFMVEGSWKFLHSTYGFILTVPDLTPNIGVFWYFFTEMFEHFRFFFLWVFQINAFIYTVPLSITLREHPLFLMYLTTFLTGIFKSYPSYADAALFLCLLPLWRHTFSYMRNKLVVACMFICSTVFGPIMWHLWIYSGSANANFYFAITLVYSTAEIFLVTDLLFAFLKREYHLIHGVKPEIINGKPAQVILQ